MLRSLGYRALGQERQAQVREASVLHMLTYAVGEGSQRAAQIASERCAVVCVLVLLCICPDTGVYLCSCWYMWQGCKSKGAPALAAATGEREGGGSRAGAVDLGQGSLITSQIPPLNRYLNPV